MFIIIFYWYKCNIFRLHNSDLLIDNQVTFLKLYEYMFQRDLKNKYINKNLNKTIQYSLKQFWMIEIMKSWRGNKEKLRYKCLLGNLHVRVLAFTLVYIHDQSLIHKTPYFAQQNVQYHFVWIFTQTYQISTPTNNISWEWPYT